MFRSLVEGSASWVYNKRTMEPYIVFCDQEDPGIEVLGGKGTNLKKLYDAGFDVPSFLTITSSAYLDFLSQNDLLSKIELLKSELKDTLEPGSLYTWFSEAFLSARMPAGLQNELDKGVRRLHSMSGQGSDSLAVRSSATLEDADVHSFAGVQETYLNIRDLELLEYYVKRCYLSAWRPAAVSYRDKMGIGGDDFAMAVVIQPMIHAECSGIIFTIDPTPQGSKNNMVITAGLGLGEGIVGQKTNADTFIIDKETLSIESRQISEKKTCIVPREDIDGVIEVKTDPSLHTRPALTDEEVTALGKTALKIVELFEGKPQDIEWAKRGDRFFILQSRPITGL